MAFFFNRIVFKGTTQITVVAAIRAELPQRECFVEKERGGWVVVVEKECNETLADPVVSVAGAICRTCKCPAIAFSVVHSDYLCYWVFDENGNLVDESCPEDDTEPLSEESEFGLLGKPASIAALASERGVTEEAVRAALCAGEPGCMEISVQKLFKLLGIESETYNYDDIRETAEAVGADPAHPSFVGMDWREHYVWIRGWPR